MNKRKNFFYFLTLHLLILIFSFSINMCIAQSTNERELYFNTKIDSSFQEIERIKIQLDSLKSEFKNTVHKYESQIISLNKLKHEIETQNSLIDRLKLKINNIQNTVTLILIMNIVIILFITGYFYLRRNLYFKNKSFKYDLSQINKLEKKLNNNTTKIDSIFNKINNDKEIDLLSYLENVEDKIKDIKIILSSNKEDISTFNNRLNNIEKKLDKSKMIDFKPGVLHTKTPSKEQLTTNNLKNLIRAYDKCQKIEKYAAVSDVIENLINQKSVDNSDDALNIIDYLTRIYPQAIRMGRIRGVHGNKIAIFKDKLYGGQ